MIASITIRFWIFYIIFYFNNFNIILLGICAEICEAQNPKRNAARIARRKSIHPGYDEISEELLHSARAIIEADNEMQRIKDKIGMLHEI